MNHPEFALLNGAVWTGDNLTPHIEAFAVHNGKITAAGTTEEIRTFCGKETEIFDAEQKVVLPGFIDSHVHFVMGGFSLLAVDLSTCNSRNEFIEAIRRQNDILSCNTWLTGSGWDHSRWTPVELPDKKWIDLFANDRPVYLLRQDMHMAIANSRALELAGINETTPDPDGGVIDRDPDTKLPTGILRDAAMKFVENVIPEPDNAAYASAIEAACLQCRRFGVTGVHDITAMQHIQRLDHAAMQDWFTVKLFSRPPLKEWETIGEISRQLAANSDLFRIGGLKAFTDGSLGSSTALFMEPYSDNPDNCGVPNEIMHPEGNLLRLAQAADADGFQLSIHAIGDRANHLLLDIYEQIRKENGDRDRRWRIEHAQHVIQEDFPRFRELEVIASMQPYHCIDDARWCEKRIGKERCKTTYAFKTFSEHKVRLVFGSDWTVAPLNPLTGIDAAVNRIPFGDDKPWHPEQKISIEEAVKAYTIHPAYAAFEERQKGTVSPGKAADCVVLSDNIFSIPPESIKDVTVAATIFNGKVVFSK